MSDFSKLKVKKNSKEYILNVCTQDTEQNITGTKNFSKLTVNSKNLVSSVNGVDADASGNVTIQGASCIPDYSAIVTKSVNTVYTAECDGYITAQVKTASFTNSSGGGTLHIYNSSDNIVLSQQQHGAINNAHWSGSFSWFVPIPKGYKYKLEWFGYANVYELNFIPFK